MARVYSAQLCSADSVTGVFDLGGPGDGYIWVLRHGTCEFGNDSDVPLGGFSVGTNTGHPIWTVGLLGVCPRVTYHYSGRQVLNAGEVLEFSSADAGYWDIVISGYELALP